jgi:hypothetical protein
MSTQPGNPQDVLAVKNTLSRYCEALDTKVFPLLDKVFTTDIVAKYPFRAEELKGVDAVRDAILGRLGPIRTHHNLTTQIITFSSDGKTAFSTTHFIGIHFGQGKRSKNCGGSGLDLFGLGTG